MRGGNRQTSVARGVTMVEMVMVIVVVGAIFAVGALVLGRAFESYDLAHKTTDVDWQGRVGMERVARDLRDLRSRTANDVQIPALSTDPLRFRDADGYRICYFLNGSNLMREQDTSTTAVAGMTCAAGSSQVLADNVTALNFFYYQNDGSVAAVGQEALLFYVSVNMSVQSGGISETYRTSVQPRRF
jgi:hypothetical protein